MGPSNASGANKKGDMHSKKHQNSRNQYMIIMHPTLAQPNLSHMGFLEHPAASMGCTIPVSRYINDGGTNELQNSKMSTKNDTIVYIVSASVGPLSSLPL